jgi:uncharacterized membrane protein
MHPVQRILISLVLSFIVFFFMWRQHTVHSLLLGMLFWDVFAFTYLIMSFIVLGTRNTLQMQQLAKQEDSSRVVVSILIVTASFASLFMVLLLILSKEATSVKSFYLPVAIAGVLLSWIMVHTIFTFHYAMMYYDDDDATCTNVTRLSFPNQDTPDYFDFAYFSFVIGMTFQVSDVQINSSLMRRQALAHGLISFALNTFVVALTINLIAGLRG